MTRKTLIFLASLVGIAVLVAGPLILIKRGQFQAMASAPQYMPPSTVTATPVAEQNWENLLSATGSFAPVQGVTVAAETPGKVVKIGFEAGATVESGALLVQLDTSTEEAQLRAAEATANLGRANLARARDLRQSSTNSPAELDAAEAQAKQAEAQADTLRAVIAKKTIRAPFGGRLGLRVVNLGQIVREGDAITTLQTLDPIYINFSLPQQRLAQVAAGTKVRVVTDAAPGATFDGVVTALNSEVDATTRNVRVQATISNKEEKLRAGMFANVEVVLPKNSEVLAIPVTAVSYAPYGDAVFVVEDPKDDKTGKAPKSIRQQFVRLGAARGDFVAVAEGLKAGQMVVTSGVFKLHSGMPVVIDNTLAPKAELNPKPLNK